MSIHNKTFYVILNGPPGSGKTTIARELCRELNRKTVQGQGKICAVQDSFAAPLKHFIATALGDKYNEMDKEMSRPELFGHSVRQFIIFLAEEHLKPRYGLDIFAKWLVNRSLRYPGAKPDYYIVDDGGFQEEVDAVPNRFIVQIHRPDKTFIGDCRGYVEGYRHVFVNNGDFIHLVQSVAHLAKCIRITTNRE